MANLIETKELSTAAAARAASNPYLTVPAANYGTRLQTGVEGISQNTLNALNNYLQGYRASDAVTAAQDYLTSVIDNRPQADRQLEDLYAQVLGRGGFSYDPSADALYGQYRDQYVNLGRQAMMDAVGSAAAMTGGYGNSYAATVGNQAYQRYLQQINDALPTYYQMAFDRWNAEGDALRGAYEMAYGRYRDSVSDWQDEAARADAEYWSRYNADYSAYSDLFDFWTAQAQREAEAFGEQRDYYRSVVAKIIEKKQMPSAELLAAAGITAEEAMLMGAKVKKSSGKKSTSASTAVSASAAPGNYLFYANADGRTSDSARLRAVSSSNIEKVRALQK